MTTNTTNTNNINNTNILPDLNTPKVFYPIMTMIIFMIIILFITVLNINIPFKKSSKSQEEIVANIFIVLFFILLLVGLCIVLLPNFKDVKTLFQQISNVTYIIIYTIFLILFFTITPNNIVDKYARVIIPITVLLGGFMFYKASKYNYVEKFNITYERIKTIIMLFCLITIFIIYYNSDPGGYIKQNFGYTMLLTIIISVFGFLYLIIILTLPDKIKEISPESNTSNFLENFTKFSSYGSIGFLLFIIAITVIISRYPGGFFNDKITSSFAMIMILIICILWSLLLGSNLFSENSNNINTNNKVILFKKSLLILFGVIISCLIIFWIVYNIQNMSSKSGTISLILNLLLVTIVLGLIYKTINVNIPYGNSKKNAFFSLIINILFYIPCLFNQAFNYIAKFFVDEYNANTMGTILMLVFAIILLIIYFSIPSLFNKFNLQGGKQLLDKPVYTDSLYSLGTYEELNGNDNINYQYAISFWVFIDAAPPNTNSSYNKFTSLLNYGNKPNILYNGTTHTLMVTMQQKDLDKKSYNKLTDFDENNNRILYKNNNLLLQKWNNVIINYNGGILDIFLNGELVKSDIGVVPYYTLDNLTIGENDGIKGGIKNIIYFKKALNSSNIYYLYNII